MQVGVLTSDGRLLFATRVARMFGYGLLSVVLVLYLVALGIDGLWVGAILTLTLLGDAAISLWLTTHADRLGRRTVLLTGAGLMLAAGRVFAVARDPWILLLAATVGVISPSGNEVGPFLAVEQAALSQTLPDRQRTRVFGWYNLVGSLATASGALGAGLLAQLLQGAGAGVVDSYRAIVVAYALVAIALAALFWRLSPAIEVPKPAITSIATRLGLHRSRGIVLRLAALFSLDAFAGGFVMQSLIAYWFHVRFGAPPGALGAIFFGANILAGFSALAAARLAGRIGLINTMVFTHIPSNLLLIAVPLMPNLQLAVGVLLARFAISQMDVPTRQSYTMAVVDPDERSAAAGVTGIARSLGAAVSPSLATPMVQSVPLAGLPFVIAGVLKIGYDLLVYRGFRSVRPPEEAE
ncbi:MAG TPA: MFS transporter [Candidatus Saccharimonadales bacterium]|nr:MFS transporter [Candidatus Saccharimonadales bacterium]